LYCSIAGSTASPGRKWATAKLVEKNKKIRLATAKKTIQELEKG
jgi:hypothetical protein